MAKLSLSHEVGTPPDPGTGSLTIVVKTQPDITAPAPIYLEAKNHTDLAAFIDSGAEYDGAFHEYQHVWTVRGSPLSAATAPVNMPTEWNNPNKAYGRKVFMYLPDPGDYIIDLVVTDRLGNTATASTSTITVVDSDTIYPGTQTICLSTDPSETWVGEKTGCTRATTLAEAIAALTPGATRKRLLCRRGTEMAMTETLRINDSLECDYIGAWGTGDKPIWKIDDTRETGWEQFIRIDGTNQTQLTITDLDWRGGWDASTETYIISKPPLNLRNRGAWAAMMHNCDIRGFDSFDFTCAESIGSDQWSLMANCTQTDFVNFGYRSSNNENMEVGIVACRIMQNVEALHADPEDGRSEINNMHGPVRTLAPKFVYFSQCDNFSRSGWSGLASENGPGTADQPAMRMNTNAVRGAANIVERCVLEGGYKVVLLQPAVAGNVERPGNFLFDKVVLIATSKTIRTFFDVRFGSFTMRNCIGVTPDVSGYHTANAPIAMIETQLDNPDTGMIDVPHRYYNNTLVNLQADARDEPLTNSIVRNTGTPDFQFSDIVEENNVIHSPNITTPQTLDAPIDLTAAVSQVTPRFRGIRYGFLNQFGSLPTAIDVGGSWTISYPSGTDQAFWLAREAAGKDAHMLVVYNQSQSNANYYSRLGDFGVSFGASNITITRNSTRVTGAWPSGNNYRIKLDRIDLLDPMDYTFGTPTHTLNFDNQTDNFTVGELITGGTSGAKAGIVRQSDSGTTGTLTIHMVSGTFADTEEITGATTGVANVNGTATALVPVPLARPTTGSAAIDDATTGRVAVDDLLGTARGATPSRGALQET